MRLALIVPGGVDPSGEYRVIPALLALIRRLAARHDLEVFALAQGPEPGQWQLLGAAVHNIGAGHTLRRCVAAVRAAHRRAPFDLVHSIWAGGPGLVAVAAARLLRIPSLVHVAGGEPVALPEIGYGGRLTLRGRMREALVLRAAHRVSAASAPMIAALAALGVSARRVPLGVDLERWPPRAPARRAPGASARLIQVASLNRVKDQPTLLRALAALHEGGCDFTLDIVGEDTEGGAVQSLAERLGLGPRVRFHGFLPQRSLRPLLEAADLMLVSSRHEAGPLAVLEAAIAGVPTAGTAVGHIAEWAPEAAGAAAPGDAEGLAHVARSMLSDEELRLRIAQRAQAIALREDADHTARAFESLYTELGARH